MPVGTPGTTANGTDVRATASDSLTAASSANGSPATRRTTLSPLRASAPSSFAVSAGVASGARTSTAGERDDRGRHRGVGDHQVGVPERFGRVPGQQSGITGTSPDEGDSAKDLARSSHDELPII